MVLLPWLASRQALLSCYFFFLNFVINFSFFYLTFYSWSFRKILSKLPDKKQDTKREMPYFITRQGMSTDSDLSMAPLYRNHFSEGIDFIKNSLCHDRHCFPESALVPSFVIVSCPCWHFTVILSPAENPACSSQFPCNRICGGDFLKAPRPL